jgi:hypothetical protein
LKFLFNVKVQYKGREIAEKNFNICDSPKNNGEMNLALKCEKVGWRSGNIGGVVGRKERVRTDQTV